MSVVLDILRSYRAPRRVIGARMSNPPHEGRALAILLGGCALVFVAQWPRLSRASFLDPSIAFDARLMGALFGWLVVMPLVFYVLALLIQVVMQLAGAETTGFRVRLALFWALLASSPLWLLTGLAAGFAAKGVAGTIIGALAPASFLGFAFLGLSLARRPTEAAI